MLPCKYNSNHVAAGAFVCPHEGNAWVKISDLIEIKTLPPDECVRGYVIRLSLGRG